MPARPHLRSAGPLAALAATLLAPSSLLAAPPLPEGFDRGGYLQISGGLPGRLIDQQRFSSEAQWFLPWSIGGGWMFAPSGSFRATAGLAFEHRMIFLEPRLVHGLNAVAEARLGTAWRKIWIYGLLGAGVVGTFVDWGPDDLPAYFYGAAFQYGAGMAGLVYSRFFLGLELDFDVGYHPLLRREQFALEPFFYHTVTLEVLLGWHF